MRNRAEEYISPLLDFMFMQGQTNATRKRLSNILTVTTEGMTSRDIRSMSDEALLDMDYFLNEDKLDDDLGEEGFYIF